MQFEDFRSAEALKSAAEATHITDREKHLIGLAVVATRGCIACSGSRIKRAVESGIPLAAVTQAIDVAASVNAGVTLAIAIQGAEKEKIVEICEDDACTVGS